MAIKFAQKEIVSQWHLTLSVILERQDGNLENVLRMQKELSKGLSTSQSVKDGVIYAYPQHTLHFSFVNFLPPHIYRDTRELEQAKAVAEVANVLSIGSLKDFVRTVKVHDKKMSIKRIYVPQDNKSESISLNIFPSREIIGLAHSIVDRFTGSKESGWPKVKGRPLEENKHIKDRVDYFVVNIMRFFRTPTQNQQKKLNNTIEVLNEKLNRKPLTFGLSELSLVVSDDYLSNPDPVIENIILK